MASLYETLSDAQQGEAIAALGREFGLTPQQTQAAVESLLPAISLGLKQSTATPEGLGELFAIMGRQTDLHGMYDDPRAAFSREGRAAGNEVLAKMFGSPDASRAIADQAQQFSGVSSVDSEEVAADTCGDSHFWTDAQRIWTGNTLGPSDLAGPGRRIDRHSAADFWTGSSGVGRSDSKSCALRGSSLINTRWQSRR